MVTCICDRKKRARSGSGTPGGGGGGERVAEGDAVDGAMEVLGKNWMNWRESVASHTTSSHTFFPLASRMGREQKSTSHSRIPSASAYGSR
jgi:hypothetical protein